MNRASKCLRAIADVALGDFVAVNLVGPDTREEAWLIVTAIGPLGIAGTLVGTPVSPDMRRGDRVTRSWAEILDHRSGEGGYGEGWSETKG